MRKATSSESSQEEKRGSNALEIINVVYTESLVLPLPHQTFMPDLHEQTRIARNWAYTACSNREIKSDQFNLFFFVTMQNVKVSKNIPKSLFCMCDRDTYTLLYIHYMGINISEKQHRC